MSIDGSRQDVIASITDRLHGHRLVRAACIRLDLPRSATTQFVEQAEPFVRFSAGRRQPKIYHDQIGRVLLDLRKSHGGAPRESDRTFTAHGLYDPASFRQAVLDQE